MELPNNLKLGALGGPNTFGGEAARLCLERYPEFSEIVYVTTSEEGAEFGGGKLDAMCAPQQMSRTGPHPGIQGWIARPGSDRYVLADVTHEYHCSLLAKPGTPREKIRRVIGHTGSVSQSTEWLRANLPQAEIVIIDTNSMEAAREVSQGDGSVASVGTPGMGKAFGLEPLGTDIDGGSVGNYWIISRHKVFSDAPTRLVVAGRIRGDGTLSNVIDAVQRQGFRLETVIPLATGERLFEYDYALRFAGSGTVDGIERALAPFPSVRLAGAYVPRG